MTTFTKFFAYCNSCGAELKVTPDSGFDGRFCNAGCWQVWNWNIAGFTIVDLGPPVLLTHAQPSQATFGH